MKTKVKLSAILTTAMVLFSGCGGSKQVKTGYLSDYSKMQRESDASLRYVDDTTARGYSAFIVEPVVVYFHEGSKSKGKLTYQQLADLSNYLHAKIVEAVRNAGLTVADQPGISVAKIRIALTDIAKTDAINMLPQATLLGAGVGGASMEAEVVDSVTGKQIAAVLQSGQGSRVPFSNLGDWTAAKTVMDQWAKNFQAKLKAMHGNN